MGTEEYMEESKKALKDWIDPEYVKYGDFVEITKDKNAFMTDSGVQGTVTNSSGCTTSLGAPKPC